MEYNQSEIIGYLERIIPMVCESGNPEDEIVKFASERNLPPAVVERIGQVYNTAKTLNYFEKKGAASVRDEKFTLVDSDALAGRYTAFAPQAEPTTRDDPFYAMLGHSKAASVASHSEIIESPMFESRLKDIEMPVFERPRDPERVTAERIQKEAGTREAVRDVVSHFSDEMRKVANWFADQYSYRDGRLPSFSQFQDEYSSMNPGSEPVVHALGKMVEERSHRDSNVKVASVEDVKGLDGRELVIKGAAHEQIDTFLDAFDVIKQAVSNDGVDADGKKKDPSKSAGVRERGGSAPKPPDDDPLGYSNYINQMPEQVKSVLPHFDKQHPFRVQINELQTDLELGDEFELEHARRTEEEIRRESEHREQVEKAELDAKINAMEEELANLPEDQLLGAREKLEQDLDKQIADRERLKSMTRGERVSEYLKDKSIDALDTLYAVDTSRDIPTTEELTADRELAGKRVESGIETLKGIPENMRTFAKDISKKIPVRTRGEEQQSMIDQAAALARGEALVNEMLLTDPIISEADDEYVYDLFRTIMRVSPMVASDRNLLRSTLRSAVGYDAVDPDTATSLAKLDRQVEGDPKTGKKPKIDEGEAA